MASSSSSTATNSISYYVLNQISYPVLLLSNVCNLVSIKLDSSNYSLWRHQILPIFEAHKLSGFIDGSCPISEKFLCDDAGNSTANVNHQYADWVAQDCAIKALINSTLSPSVLSLVVGCVTSRETWVRFEIRFSSVSRFHIIQLRSSLQTLIKKADESIYLYVQRAKDLKDRLTNAGISIDDEEMLIYVLNGLSSEYNVFRTSIRTRSDPIAFEHLYALLKTEELTIETHTKNTEALVSATALLSLNRSQDASRGSYTMSF